MDRRALLALLVKGSGLLTAGIIAIPGILMALSPTWRKRSFDNWQSVGQADRFEVGSTREAQVSVPRDDWARKERPGLRAKSVYVWRPSQEEFVVFSRDCTDLTCPVNYDPGSTCFFCPCHGGIFLQDGTPIAGPPRTPLYRYATRIRDGALEIDLDSLPPTA